MRRTSALTWRSQPGRSRRTFRPDSDSVLSMMYVATARPPTLRVLAQRSKVYHHAGAPPSARNGRAAMTTLRSRNWFGPRTLDGLMNRAYLRAEGFSDLVFDGRPVVGVPNSWSELNNCNAPLRQVAEAVKRGVWSAGGFPLEFPTISLGEILMKPTTMLFRNLMAMDVEECIRASPLDPVALAGARAVELALAGGPRPSEVLTAQAFDNAIRTDMAIGGSTNAIVHLLALAGRAGVDLTLRRFDELSKTTPLLVNVKPSGKHLMEDFFHAGGLPVVLRELLPLLHGEAPTVTGRSLADNVRDARCWNEDVIRPLGIPLAPEGGTVILFGNLCPDGAVLKQSAASPALLVHRGRAVVFEHQADIARRIDDPALAIDETSVLVLKHAGPKGAPGMPEWGAAPVPARLLKRGVTDMVRISDARMSGTSYGTVVLHMAPESAVGGPLALVRDGDQIELHGPARRR